MLLAALNQAARGGGTPAFWIIGWLVLLAAIVGLVVVLVRRRAGRK
jgi:hypothetical protein